MSTPDFSTPHLGIIPRPAHLNVATVEPVIQLAARAHLRLTDSASEVWAAHLSHWSSWLAKEIDLGTGACSDAGPTGAAGHLPAADTITISHDQHLATEAYHLSVDSAGVTIRGGGAPAVQFALATLAQLIGTRGPALPELHIEDYPRYRERGVLVDPARSFLSVAEVKTLIDLLARYKFNRLHLHLTDDQGWRIAIGNAGKAPDDPHDYTRLAQVSGATAVGPTVFNRQPGNAGYYSGEDLREICAYGRARAIRIIAEFDIPAHTRAALHALPDLNSARSYPPADPSTGCAPAFTATDVGESSLDPDNPHTYHYIGHVARALLDMTGTAALHLGGDESHSTDDRAYAQLMSQALPQVAQMEEKPEIIVWNEAVDKCDLPQGTTVQIWTGQASPALRSHVRERGGTVLVSSAPHFYLAQRPAEEVPSPTWACGGPLGLEQVLDGDPTDLATVAESQVAGVEATVWNEHLRGIAGVTFMLVPRALAVAEIGWSPRQDWDRSARAALYQRIAAHEHFFSAAGLTFHAAPEIDWPTSAGAALAPGMITAEEAAERARAHWADAPLLSAPSSSEEDTHDGARADFLTGADLHIEVSSQESVGEPLPHGRVRALSDGSPESYWHTRWHDELAEWPPTIDISWDHPARLRAVALAQRPHSPMAGSVTEVAISTEEDGTFVERTRVRLDPACPRVRIAVPRAGGNQAVVCQRLRITIVDSLGGRAGQRGTAQHSSSASRDWQRRQIAALSEVAIEIDAAPHT